MGEIADDMTSGACCEECGIYFRKAHGYPVRCNHCWSSHPQWERKKLGLQCATIPELGIDLEADRKAGWNCHEPDNHR